MSVYVAVFTHVIKMKMFTDIVNRHGIKSVNIFILIT